MNKDESNQFEKLPDELINIIFDQLADKDLGRVQLICKRFHDIAIDPKLWEKRLFQSKIRKQLSRLRKGKFKETIDIEAQTNAHPEDARKLCGIAYQAASNLKNSKRLRKKIKNSQIKVYSQRDTRKFLLHISAYGICLLELGLTSLAMYVALKTINNKTISGVVCALLSALFWFLIFPASTLCCHLFALSRCINLDINGNNIFTRELLDKQQKLSEEQRQLTKEVQRLFESGRNDNDEEQPLLTEESQRFFKRYDGEDNDEGPSQPNQNLYSLSCEPKLNQRQA